MENSNGSLTNSDKEEYPKTISETEDEVVIDFTDTEKPEPTPPPVPEGKTEIKDTDPEHPVNTDPTVTAPSKEASESNTPSPGSSNGNGAVYDPVFGWVIPGEIQQSTGNSDGDINKQVGNMG